jgi:hypothetical protein
LEVSDEMKMPKMHVDGFVEKSEEEVFFKETLPFLQELRKQVNPMFSLHMLWNYPLLFERLQLGDMNMHPITQQRGPAISIGSGPSLDCAIPHLNTIRETHGAWQCDTCGRRWTQQQAEKRYGKKAKDHHGLLKCKQPDCKEKPSMLEWSRAPIFCTASQVWTLYHQGITPDYVTQHDPWPRQCPICKAPDQALTQFDDAGNCTCSLGHQITGETRKKIIGTTNLHRWCPDIDTQFLHHPGVLNEALRWKAAERAQIYFTNFNPNIGPVDTRAIVRGQQLGLAIEELKGKSHITEKEWTAFCYTTMNLPGLYEPQDIPMYLSVMFYGQGNPQLRNPLRVAAPYAPSTTFQNAILAHMLGYGPIYFIGYDLCNWKGISYHRKFLWDGTEHPPGVISEETKEKIGKSGYSVDYVKIGEKYALASYASKEYMGQFAIPGWRLVEVVADHTPGNLEFYPRIGLDEFTAGGTRNVPQKQTAAKITQEITNRNMERVRL